MSHYNFKKITVVPSAKDFVDIVLSRTQRKTPTVIRKHFKISRIRQFYTRKIKFTQQTFHDKLSAILNEFPKLDDVHPFYADLMNVLYDRDHYKLALGQVNTAKHLINNVAKDYVRLFKFGDSLYRCKQLKRSALGRMCTIMKRQNQSLRYLEQVSGSYSGYFNTRGWGALGSAPFSPVLITLFSRHVLCTGRNGLGMGLPFWWAWGLN